MVETRVYTDEDKKEIGQVDVIDSSGYHKLGSASETQHGLVELATTTEVAAGTDNERAVTPAGLASMIDTTIVAGATFTVNAETSNTITVNVQLQNAAGNDINHMAGVHYYLSNQADGSDFSTSNPTVVGNGVGGLDGFVMDFNITDRRTGYAVSEVDGDIDFKFSFDYEATYYLVIILESGKLAISSAIVFAM